MPPPSPTHLQQALGVNRVQVKMLAIHCYMISPPMRGQKSYKYITTPTLVEEDWLCMATTCHTGGAGLGAGAVLGDATFTTSYRQTTNTLTSPVLESCPHLVYPPHPPPQCSQSPLLQSSWCPQQHPEDSHSSDLGLALWTPALKLVRLAVYLSLMCATSSFPCCFSTSSCSSSASSSSSESGNGVSDNQTNS